MGTLWTRLVVWSFVVAGGASAAAEPGELRPPDAADPARAREALSGTGSVVNAAWWGFDEHDATGAIQGAIDSGAATVVVPYVGRPWIVTPIALRSDLDLVFEPGVLVVAKAGAFKGKGDCLFRAVNANDVTLRGYGATLRMRKDDYQSEPYQPAEWRMTLDFMGCRRVRVEGLRLENSGGDGIYLGATEELPYCADVAIRDVVCHGHHRQGISVISAVNLLIENCALSSTGGTSPEAGIDLEPNRPEEKLVNCVIRNCVMADNAGAGILVYVKNLSRTSDPVSVLFERCLVRGGRDAGIAVGALKDDGPQGVIEFRDCTVENTAKAGLYVYDKSCLGAGLRFVNCHWRNTWAAADVEHDGPRIPLMLALRRPQLVEHLGGLTFVDCSVYDSVDRPAFLVEEDESALGVTDLTGVIWVANPHGARMELGAKTERVTLVARPATD
ncbi:MAG: right-handed parallel beta-helix repeat-containing protein [Candidatus Hydrogenedentes bacterium]|nr:right-handed parallel beta-helix repeat-containing protein [Candidatus Hydrogenedentota bacterium]